MLSYDKVLRGDSYIDNAVQSIRNFFHDKR